MGTFSQRLKAMDIYRRIPKDLTEATLAGGSISLISMGLCAFLFCINLYGFFNIETITHVHVDHSQDGLFRMNFNITLPRLSCQYAAVGPLPSLHPRADRPLCICRCVLPPSTAFLPHGTPRTVHRTPVVWRATTCMRCKCARAAGRARRHFVCRGPAATADPCWPFDC